MTQDPIRWLAAEQPAVAAPDAAATARARGALIGHAAGDAGSPAAPARAARAPRPARRWLRPSRVLALAATAAAAAVAAVAITALTGGSGSLAVPEASAAPLVALSQRVAAAPAPPGDATLVLRVHRFPDGTSFTGADLYEDGGDYYYAPTLAGLRAQVAAGTPVGGPAVAAAEIAAVAAAAAPDRDIDQAVRDAIRSTWVSGPQNAVYATAPAAAPSGAGAAALQRELAEKRARAASRTPASEALRDENRLWIACMDALEAAAGRADVRAGALRLLAHSATIHATTATVAGRPALVVSSTGFGDGYQEELALDAKTGIPFRFDGGYPGRAPSVVVDYDISRVTAARL